MKIPDSAEIPFENKQIVWKRKALKTCELFTSTSLDGLKNPMRIRSFRLKTDDAEASRG